MEEHVLYWIWLTIKPSITATKITCLWDRFETIEDIYNASEYNDIEKIGQGDKKALMDKDLTEAREVIAKTEKAGAKILTFDAIDFPDMLRNIIDPPYVLYIKGEIMNWDRLLPIGIIGARECTDYGRLVTSKISRDLTKMGVTIVSGMARGLDSEASWAALRAGGKTIAVIGSGIDVVYPPENANLFKEICEHGAVITEYPPGSSALGGHFPERNRIIAGLSKGLLVTEAGERSGTSITARYALENGRDIFAVPGNIYAPKCIGTNKLIQQGAKLVMNAMDIMEEYPYAAKLLKPPKIQVVIKTQNLPSYKIEDEEKIHIQNEQIVTIEDKKYSFLKNEEKDIIKLLIESNKHIDDIVRELDKPAGEVNTLLSMLEIKALIKKLPGNNYQLKL